MNISGSSYITKLAIKTTWDISGTLPAILIENLSEGPNLAGCSWWFVALAPGDIPIHEGSEDDPDITGDWDDEELNDNWPKAFNNILWSGAPYSMQVFVKDGDGNVYEGVTQLAYICHPNGNKKTSTNAYGLATCYVQVKCADGRVFFQDTTNATYQGITGTQGSSVLRVTYPPDEAGNVPDPFVGAHFTTALVPITYSSDSYMYQSSSVYDYDFGGDVHIRVKYLSFNPVNGSPAVRFAVLCNIDLCSLMCEVDKLVQSIDSGNCVNVQEATEKLSRINPLLWMVSMGIQQPLCGVDVPGLIDQIKAIGGFECNCCNAPTGIIPTSSSVIDGYNFQVVSECGDISGSVEKTGNNIQIILSDKTYTFAMCGNSPAETTAFNFTKVINGCVAEVCLNVDVTQLSYDLLNNIKGDAALVNLFNSIVISSGGGINLLVDGKCIFNTGAACDYIFTLSDIPEDTTYAILTGYKLSGSDASVPLSFAFNLTNLPDLQAYLNGLGIGTFVVTNPSGQTVVFESEDNTFGITALSYAIGVSNYIAEMSQDCSGFVPLSANEVVQKIINYLCDIDDSQVSTSAEYEVCWVDGNGVKQTEVVAAGSELAEVVALLTEKGCISIDYIVALKSVNCKNVQALYPQDTEKTMQANDVFNGTKNGECAGIYPTEAFLAMLTYGKNNADVLAAFCEMVELCGAGLPCDSYNVFYADVTPGSPGEADLTITFEHPDAVSNTIRYARIDNTVSPSYITISGVLPGASPYTISDVENGQYRFGITPVYADGRSCKETFYDTTPCEGIIAFNAIYDGANIIITGTLEEGLDAKVTILYPNGGTYSAIYTTTEGALSETIAPPAEVYGVFFATLKAVCDTNSGYMSASSAPASFEIPEPSP